MALLRQDEAVTAPEDGAAVVYWDRPHHAAATFAAGVSLSGVGKRFGRRQAVAGVSLDIAAGEVVCLLGPSGCGKSTLLRMIAGVERPDEGRIAIDNIEVAAPGVFVPPELRGVGLMFQDFALFPHLSIVDNVAFGLRRLGRAGARAEAMAALGRMRLADCAAHYPHMLSGGQQQRVALARALAPRPAVMLMDEPFSGLDSRLRVSVRDETLAVLREARATAIVVTHDAEEAMRMGDRIAVMRGGRLVQVGTADELYDRPISLFVAEMFSELNVIPYQVRDGWAEGPLGRFRSGGCPEGRAVLCLRPCELELGTPDHGFPATVLEARRVGPDALTELAVEGLELPVTARVRGAYSPEKGAEAGLFVNPDRVLIFPCDADT